MKKRSMIILAITIGILIGALFIYMSFFGRMRMNGSSNHMMEGMHDSIAKLENKTGEQGYLNIPPIIKGEMNSSGDIVYSLTAENGAVQFKDGEKTKTMGYNGSFLGPTIVVKKGQNIQINLINHLNNEQTTFHWHGLIVPSDMDGGPHSPIDAGKQTTIAFHVNQEAATLWYHPHVIGKTAEQVYLGLAGILIVKDENESKLGLPEKYGIDDIPVVVQDRTFTDTNQFDYEKDYRADGTAGNTLLVNGTINPYIDVTTNEVRLRLLNGSNARIYTFSLSDNSTFKQIATDGGLLNSPVEMQALSLSPGERAEVIINTDKMYKNGDVLSLMTGDIAVLKMQIGERKDTKNTMPIVLNQLPEINDFSMIDRKIVLSGMAGMVEINQEKFNEHRIDAYGTVGKREIWEIYNQKDMMGGMVHPFHIHGTQFRIISRNGISPAANERGWKDTVAINPDERVKLEVMFIEKGIFMYHCHILEHEDNGMMAQIKIE
ncbi:Multicopper oxidase with three cupredoxin domains (includes cell division protein FtsP and spore coat protein CotA) [Propionispira arboris]|uniref:Multicopper oxidase with three cupredoxin domains (Includes cell division protein FtsP and spore coat protein CotA) n=1 Tax=Propionispira arboris TaxID=84035 RepID=A0A1H7C1X6_9FIRM|nr:multicopper oxidase domain-containing protein [Propionispira arboris]SEJ83799.1 Multicopper oxidase with three cupredoxin domains (includes cell division protein FtsP and spore coat protein CotA) [Propionispira arboris]